MSETDSLLNSDELRETIDELNRRNAKLQLDIIESQEREKKLKDENDRLQIESDKTKSELEKVKLEFENIKRLIKLDDGENEDEFESKPNREDNSEKKEFSNDNERINELEREVEEKCEIIKELTKTKEFLAENNSKLLSDIIQIQVFMETIGLKPVDLRAYKDVLERSNQAQLKYCDDECEQVMVKLGQLENNHSQYSRKKAASVKSNIVFV